VAIRLKFFSWLFCFSRCARLPGAKLQKREGSQNGNGGYYVPVQGSALNNWKLKAFNGGGTELTAGAYPASITSDIVQVTITARKLQ